MGSAAQAATCANCSAGANWSRSPLRKSLGMVQFARQRIVDSRGLQLGWAGQSDQRAHVESALPLPATGLSAMAAPKLKPTTTSGQLVFVFKPVERRQHILGFCLAIVGALAQPVPRKLKRSTGKPKPHSWVVQHLHGVVDDIIVQGSAAQRDEDGRPARQRARRARLRFSSASSRPAGPGSRCSTLRSAAVSATGAARLERVRPWRSFHSPFYAHLRSAMPVCGQRELFQVRGILGKPISHQ